MKAAVTVIETTIDDLISSTLAHNAWALLDSPDPNVSPNLIFTSERARVFIVYSSPPNGRYEYLVKHKDTMNHVMGNWSFGGIRAGFVQVLSFIAFICRY